MQFVNSIIEVQSGVGLFLREWKQKRNAKKPVIVFLPGWVSSIDGWKPVLEALAVDYNLYYLESREKESAIIDSANLKSEDFSVNRMAMDLKAVIETLELKDKKWIIAGSSLGATIGLHALKEGYILPAAAFCIAPNFNFHFPIWADLILHVPENWFGGIKYLVLWYLKTFRVDAKNEPEQMKRYNRTISGANPLRIKLSANALHKYTIWDKKRISGTPVCTTYAPTDKLHSQKHIQKLSLMIDEMTTMECPSNKYMHSCEIIKNEFHNFMKTLNIY